MVHSSRPSVPTPTLCPNEALTQEGKVFVNHLLGGEIYGKQIEVVIF